MKIISAQQIAGLAISPVECLQWIEYCFRIKYNSVLPPKISIHAPGEVFFNTMPCYLPAPESFFGAKLVSRFPNRTPALQSEILLYDATSGELLALLDGDWITAMRTGAVATLAIKMLRSTQATVYAFMGLGNTARATLSCLLESSPTETFHVKLLAYKHQEESFIERMSQYNNVRFTICQSTQELITESDVIVSCITVATDLIGRDEWFKEGVLVVPVHTRGFQNCDLFFDKVYADDTQHVNNFKYFNRFQKFDEMSQVLLHKSPGRENNTERILSYNIGIALHAIYFASEIYKRTINNTPVLKWEKPQTKFWV